MSFKKGVPLKVAEANMKISLFNVPTSYSNVKTSLDFTVRFCGLTLQY